LTTAIHDKRTPLNCILRNIAILNNSVVKLTDKPEQVTSTKEKKRKEKKRLNEKAR